MKTLTKAVIGLSAAGAAGAAYLLIQKSRHEISAEAANHVDIHGFVSPGFEAVREAFVENFVRRREVGAACCVYHQGEKVVDLWGGVRNKTTGEPLGRKHNGSRLFGNQRLGGDEPGDCTFSWLARLR